MISNLKGWETDALKVQLAFMRHFQMQERPEWADEDWEDLAFWCGALMQASCQMDSGQRGGAKVVAFEDLPTIQNNVCVLACRLILSRGDGRNPGLRDLKPEPADSLERIAEEIERADVDGCVDWAERLRKLAKEGDGE